MELFLFIQNPNITLDIVKSNPDKKWCYLKLTNSRKKDVTKDIIVEIIKKQILYFREQVTEELMSVMWHPSRVHIWKYLDDFDIEI